MSLPRLTAIQLSNSSGKMDEIFSTVGELVLLAAVLILAFAIAYVADSGLSGLFERLVAATAVG